MSFWSDIGDAISKAVAAVAAAVEDIVNAVAAAIEDVANAVAAAVEDVANAVAEAVSDVVETVGNAVSDAAAAVGDALGGLPVVGGALSAAFHWVGDVVSGVTELVAGVIKGVLGAVGGVVGGLIRVVGGGIGGLLNGDGSVFVKGLVDIASGIGGAVVIIGGKLIGLVQSVIPLQWGKRPLTKQEQDILRRVFRRSVALYNVRIIEGFAGIYSINEFPFTLGNTIYIKGYDPATQPAVLVHECTHVWQYQNNGSRYTADAIGAQWFVDDEYNWEKERARGNTRWQDFNAEAEAKFLQDAFVQGRVTGVPATGKGEFYNDDPVGSNVEFVYTAPDHSIVNDTVTALARDSVAYVRGAFSWRLSGLI